MNVALIGAGNVATQLGIALQAAGFPIVQVYSRTEGSASRLADRLHVMHTTDVRAIIRDADLYVFSLKDEAIVPVLQQMEPLPGLFVHTAGSLPADIFRPYARRYGVFYPLQTFSREKNVSFEHIPILYEASDRNDESLLQAIAGKLSKTFLRMDSEKRKYLHLAAVFACNFTNYMYALATGILEEEGISRQLLLPLIEEAASKIRTLHPRAAQTGPAVRHDTETMEKHLELLPDADKRMIYQMISNGIYRDFRGESKSIMHHAKHGKSSN
jgi:predicted short-subunit dehydrogenase-like oxidoreductase (DUF2520 family)